jgi:KUP system potassium uptake protein
VHTSKTEGQIFVPVVNYGLAVGVATLVLVFKHSSNLANIYGVAVTGTFVLDTVLFLAVARGMWKTSLWKLVPVGALFLTVEGSFFLSNISKVAHGAFIPLLVGLTAAIVMVTWRTGYRVVTRNRTEAEESLDAFLYQLRMADPPVHRVPTLAVYLSPGKETTPLAMKADVEHHGVFHEKVLIVSIESISIPHVEPDDRFSVEVLGSGLFKIQHVTIYAGYHDSVDVPRELALARKRGFLARNLDLEHARYFVSRMKLTASREPCMARWRKALFVAMVRNASSPIDHFGLPVSRTVVVSSHVAL